MERNSDEPTLDRMPKPRRELVVPKSMATAARKALGFSLPGARMISQAVEQERRRHQMDAMTDRDMRRAAQCLREFDYQMRQVAKAVNNPAKAIAQLKRRMPWWQREQVGKMQHWASRRGRTKRSVKR